MSLDIIDISTSIIRAATDAVRDLHKIEITSFPPIEKERVVKPHILGLSDDYITLITLDHPPTLSTGFLIMYINKSTAKMLLQNKGIENPSTVQIIDTCREMCSAIAQKFTDEIARSGIEGLTMNPPKIFIEGANEPIPHVFVDEKYVLKISKLGRQLFELQIALESLSS